MRMRRTIARKPMNILGLRFLQILLLISILCAICVLVVSFFVYPAKAQPHKVDAILVLAGSSDGRHELGAQLVEEGYSSNFVVSNPAGAKDKVGYAHCAGAKRPSGATSYCMDPYPVITSGEARTFNELAAEHGWQSVLVVTSRTHTQRVRLMFNECFSGDSTVYSVPNPINRADLKDAILHEIGGFAKFWITSPC